MRIYPDHSFWNDPRIAGFNEPRIGFRGPRGEQYVYDAKAPKRKKVV